MYDVSVIFPNQLFENNPVLSKSREVFLIEENSFFTNFKFHKNKIILHRASMKYYQDFLEKQGYKVKYIEFNKDILKQIDNKVLHISNIYDLDLEERLIRANSKIVWYKTPSFFSDEINFKELFKDKKHYSQTSFYIAQRKHLGILLDKNGKPKGGKWSFDKDNRQKFNFEIEIPKIEEVSENSYVKEAKEYVEKNFPDNYGVKENFFYPITHKEVKNWFIAFLDKKLYVFGKYEDAVVKNEPILFHSCLSYALNVGLITPEEIIYTTLDFAKENPVPISSLEGFIRQVIGWREFMKNIYFIEGKEMKASNFWGHKNKLPQSLYTAKTEIEPLDDIINRTIKYSYNHHIERLMFLGNFMFMCEISPHEIYRWFMEMYIDSYEWVMAPNVYGMSQYADGGTMITKPYLSSSNYILKMSNYKKGDWCEIFDSLYWRFIDKNKDFFRQNPRLRIMYSYLQKISNKKLEKHKKVANNFLENFLAT